MEEGESKGKEGEKAEREGRWREGERKKENQ